MIRAILFDKDGTLLDFEATWGPMYRALALELAEGDASRAMAMLVSGGLDAATGRVRAGSVLGAGTSADMVALWFPALAPAEALALAATIDARCHGHGQRGSVVVSGTAKVLARLAGEGFVMGVATNDGTAAAVAALGTLGFDGWLPHIYGYDSVARPKPAGDSVHVFAAAAGVRPDEVAVVGDNRHDLEMARAAGAGAAIGVLTGNSGHADLAPLADVVLESIRELPDWLAARGAAPGPLRDGDAGGGAGRA